MNKLKVVILPHVNKSQELWDFPSRRNEKSMYEKGWKKATNGHNFGIFCFITTKIYKIMKNNLSKTS